MIARLVVPVVKKLRPTKTVECDKSRKRAICSGLGTSYATPCLCWGGMTSTEDVWEQSTILCIGYTLCLNRK